MDYFSLHLSMVGKILEYAERTSIDSVSSLKVLVLADKPGPIPPAPPVPPGEGDDNMENAFRVLFETFGDSTVPPATGLSYGDVITKSAEPEKSARSFGGWYTDEACTQEWNFADGITPTQTSAPVTTTVPSATQPSTAPPTMTTPTRDAPTTPPADTGDNGKSGGDGNGALYLLLLLLFLFFLCLLLLLRHTMTFLVTTAEGIRTYRVRVWHGKTIDPDTLPELLRTAAWYLDEERKDRCDIEEDRVIRSIRLYHG